MNVKQALNINKDKELETLTKYVDGSFIGAYKSANDEDRKNIEYKMISDIVYLQCAVKHAHDILVAFRNIATIEESEKSKVKNLLGLSNNIIDGLDDLVSEFSINTIEENTDAYAKYYAFSSIFFDRGYAFIKKYKVEGD